MFVKKSTVHLIRIFLGYFDFKAVDKSMDLVFSVKDLMDKRIIVRVAVQEKFRIF